VHKLLNIPFLILTISTIIGIVIGHFAPIPLNVVLVLQAISLIMLISLWFFTKKLFRKTYGFSIVVIIFFIIFGTTLVQIHNPKNKLDHYTKLFLETELRDPVLLNFQIQERLKPTSYYEKYIINLQSLEGKTVSGKILIQLPKDSLQNNLAIGASYITYTKIQPIPAALNPYQFDYANYLSKQYVFHKINSHYDQLINTNHTSISIYSIANISRQKINNKLSYYNFSKEQLSIINALFLGQRQDITPEVFANYRDAGAIHILAVSGLHIGILLMILHLLLKPIRLFKRKGNIIKMILIILSLWSFAIIAGLSPSILRAVTMFSFIAIGMYIRSKTSIYNALIISIFILLCFRPLLLFSVGFQLSYLAVFAIVWVQPLFIKLYHPTFYIDKILWETFTVTIAAQLGLLPLTLFYFHQFPLLFFIANLLIIPLLGILISLGILVILCAEIQILPQWLATAFGSCIDAMNYIVYWVSNHKTFIITEISFSWRMLIISYICIIALVIAFKNNTSTKAYMSFLTMTVLLAVTLSYEKHLNNNSQELVLFHNQKNTTIGVLQNQKLQLHSKDTVSEKTKNYVINNYLIANNAKIIKDKKLKNIYNYKEKTILIIDESGVYPIKDLQPDILILTNSPKIYLDRVMTHLKPTLIIADGSNYKSYLNLWEESCNRQRIPFYRTDKQGAYILK